MNVKKDGFRFKRRWKTYHPTSWEGEEPRNSHGAGRRVQNQTKETWASVVGFFFFCFVFFYYKVNSVLNTTSDPTPVCDDTICSTALATHNSSWPWLWTWDQGSMFRGCFSDSLEGLGKLDSTKYVVTDHGIQEFFQFPSFLAMFLW